MNIAKEAMMDMYLRMVRIREFENKAQSLFAEGKIPGFVHLYLGEEAVATGVCECLRDDDYITSTHRGHGHIIAKGGDLKYMMAELFGKATGYCKGKGGSMHIADRDRGILGANGIVGAGHNIAVGAGLSASYRSTDQVCACFFGDGATNQSTFHEGLNMHCGREQTSFSSPARMMSLLKYIGLPAVLGQILRLKLRAASSACCCYWNP